MRLLICIWGILLGTASASSFQLVSTPVSQFGISSGRIQLALDRQADDTAVLWRQAKAAFDRGDFAEARRVLSLAVKSNPRDASLWFHLGVSCSQLNETDQAIAAFEKARALAPRQPPTYFNLGLLYWKSGDLAKAKQAYRAGLALSPNEPSALQNYALILMKTGEYKSAIAPLSKLKNVPSLSVPTRVSLIECYLKTQQADQADREADELLRSGISQPADQTKLAGIFLEYGGDKTAVRLLIRSLELDPSQDKADATLGLIYMRQKQFDKAAPLLERAVQLDPNSAEYAMAFAQALYLWNHGAGLLAFLQSVESKFSALPEYQLALGIAYYKNAHYKEAVTTLESLLRTNPRRQDQINFWLGNAYLELSQMEDSEKAYRRAIEMNPKNPEYYEAFATLLRREGPGKLDEAITQLTHALQYSPGDPHLGLQLALCYESKENLPQAATLLENAVEREPDLLPAHIALSRIYFRLGKKSDAAREKDIVKVLQEKAQRQKANSITSAPNLLDQP